MQARADLRLEQGEPLLHLSGVVGRYTTRRVIGSDRGHQLHHREDQEGEAGPDSDSHGGCFGSYPDGGLNAFERSLSYRAGISSAIRAVDTRQVDQRLEILGVLLDRVLVVGDDSLDGYLLHVHPCELPRRNRVEHEENGEPDPRRQYM